MKPLLLLLSFLLIFSNYACSQSVSSPTTKGDRNEIYDTTDPFEVNQSLGSGVNLGNALEAPEEGEWGIVIREEYIQLIADAGFQSVRIPIRWNAHTANNSPYKIDPLFLSRVDEVVNWSLDRDLKVIINIHHFNELMESPNTQKEKFLALWTQLAEHYKDYPNDELVFEILNEPHENLNASLWNQYLRDAIEIIRETNRERVLMIGTAPWGSFDGIQSLSLPENDQQLIVTVHYYNPFQFTHQGADWAGEESENWLGTTWTGTSQEKSAVETDFDRVQQWAVEHNRPIHVGEFGAYEEAPMQSRVNWTEYIRSAAESRNFSFAYWEFGSGFGIYDRNTNQWRGGLLKALLPNTSVVD